ncbi:hypothetical protein LCGC14_1530080 [marine sediment metagenome]|uniref:Uncharacterized protein n=1 Tax=marine sediment metagenome TaxID=412755 RepID=A0A0F9LBS6_9ZZZZ
MRKIVYPLLTDATPGGKPLRVGDILANMFQPTNEEGGVTFEVMETWVPLAQKLRKAETEVLLEDAEHELLTARLAVTKWRSASEDIMAIGQAIHGAEIIEIEEAAPTSPPNDEADPK